MVGLHGCWGYFKHTFWAYNLVQYCVAYFCWRSCSWKPFRFKLLGGRFYNLWRRLYHWWTYWYGSFWTRWFRFGHVCSRAFYRKCLHLVRQPGGFVNYTTDSNCPKQPIAEGVEMYGCSCKTTRVTSKAGRNWWELQSCTWHLRKAEWGNFRWRAGGPI